VDVTKRENDTVRDKSVKKRKKAQLHQGEKLKKVCANSLQQSAEHVTQASVVLINKLHPMLMEFWPLLWREKVEAHSLTAPKL
jgi:hypothetical protein